MPTAGIERRAGDQKARSAGGRDQDDLLGTRPESITTGGLYHSDLMYIAEIGESAIGVMGLLRVARFRLETQAGQGYRSFTA